MYVLSLGFASNNVLSHCSLIKMPAEEAPVEEAPVEEAPAEEAPVEETPAEEVTVVETSIVVPVEEPEDEEDVEENKKRHLNVVFIGHVGKLLVLASTMNLMVHPPQNPDQRNGKINNRHISYVALIVFCSCRCR